MALRVTSTSSGLAMAAYLPPQVTRWLVDAELDFNAAEQNGGLVNGAQLK